MWTPLAMPNQAPVTEGIAQLPETRLWYWDTGGDGPAVVFLHAATGNGAVWGYQQPVLAQAGYRVIGYSRRGHYKSDPGDQAAPGVGSEDLQNLMRFLGIDRFHIVAVAAGGGVAADYALSYPERLLTLSLVSTTMGIVDPAYVEVGKRIRPPFFAGLPPDFQELGPSYRAGNPEGTAAWLALEKLSIVGAERLEQQTVHPLTWANVGTIRVPTMLLTGEADLYTPPSVLRVQASHLPRADVHVVREAGHQPYWEQPQIFNDLLLTFLAKHAKP